MAKFTPAKFMQTVSSVYSNPEREFPTQVIRESITKDMFDPKVSYKTYHVTTFQRKGIEVWVEFINNFVRVHVEGNVGGGWGWSSGDLNEFSLGLTAAQEILDRSNEQGANDLHYETIEGEIA